MARPLRIDFEGAIHHVFTRGTKRWLMFLDDLDRRRFLGILSLICDRYEVVVVAYCFMDNHVHVIVQCPAGGLSPFMRDLKSIYGRQFNERHRSSGPIFEDRFGSKVITSYSQLRNSVRYVHRNPYAIDSAMSLADYQWSSHPTYLGHAPCPVWLDPSIALPFFSDYGREVEVPVESDDVQNVVGLTSVAPSVAVPDTATLRTEELAIADVVSAVGHAAGVAVAQVHPSRRNGLVGLAVLVVLDDLGFTAAEAAEPLGYRTIKALQAAARRSRARQASDEHLQSVLANTRARLRRRAA